MSKTGFWWNAPYVSPGASGRGGEPKPGRLYLDWPLYFHTLLIT